MTLPAQDPHPADEPILLEMHDEQVSLSKRIVARETVQVSTTTRLRDHVVEEERARETVEVERVAIGRVVEVAPPVREEGDFIIVPVMEEVLVIERRLILKEEIRLRRIRTTEVHRETVQLREQAATVSRTPRLRDRAADPTTIAT